MKKIKYNFLLLLILAELFNASTLRAKVSDPKKQNLRIQHFIQIWGLVKYKSEKSIAGKFDADNEFLSLIDSVKNAEENQFQQMMLKLVGPIATTSTSFSYRDQKNNTDYLLKNIDYSWINNSKYIVSLKQKLTVLSNQVNASGSHHYIPTVWYENTLPNELPYADYAFNDEKMNLLTLAKAWNAIEYLFPYKYMTDKNWKQVLVEMIPVFRNINDRTSYEKGLLMLAAAINDTHGGELMEIGNLKMTSTIFNVRYYPPFDYKAEAKGIVIKRFLTDSLAKLSELKSGDQIVAINGIEIKRWLKERAALLPASNDAVKYRNLSTSNNNRGDTFAFSNLSSGTLKVKVKRGKLSFNLVLEMLDLGNKQHIQLIQAAIIQKRLGEKKIKGLENIDNDITLVRAGNFFDKDLPNDNDLPKLSAALKSKKALIFDMRKYPQAPGLFSYYLPLLLGKAPFAFARYYAANLENPGSFVHRKQIENYMYVAKDGPKPFGDLYQGKIVILTDEHTQSMGEWFTMMLSQFNDNTTIIGSQTAGADGDVKRLTLPGAYRFSFTGNGIFYPDGKETQRVGIVPDIYFKMSPVELSGDEDAHLNRAIKYIRTGR
ncbi:S41 family peptidase [Pedobacter sp.]